MNFLNKITEAFEKYPEKNAFCIKGQFYTYANLIGLVSSIQKRVDEQCKSQDKIGVLASDDFETYASILAILFSGKTYIPIHPHHPTERTQQIIAQSGIKTILSKSVSYNPSGIVTIDTSDILSSDSGNNIYGSSAGEAYAYILFTSGSTGMPKGVPISYDNLNSFVDAFFSLGYQLNENDRFLQMFDLTFDLSVMSYLIPLMMGACVYTTADTGTKFTNVYNVLEEYNITCALMVPSMITYLRPYFDEIRLTELKYSLFCGEALYKEIVNEWAKCAPNAIIENVYGPTEATIFCLTYNVNSALEIEEYNGIVSIGKPMRNMEAIIINEQGEIPDGNEKGELCLHGGQLTPGYLNDENTKKAFLEVNGKTYYRTGDIAYENEYGNYMYCGRVDHQVKIQGFRVELSEVEYHLREISGGDVVALAITNVNGLSQIDVVFDAEIKDTDALLNQLRSRLPAYMIPSSIHVVTPFPLNANGKTDRKQLEQIILRSV